MAECPLHSGIGACIESIKRDHTECSHKNDDEHKEIWCAMQDVRNKKATNSTVFWVFGLFVTLALTAAGINFNVLMKINEKVTDIAEKQAYAQGIADRQHK